MHMDVSLNQEIYLPSPNDGRQVKVFIKEIYKHTAACNACRTRKRKCDGKAPCSYCQAKKQPCEFSQQRKRGPPRRHSPEENVNNSVGFVAKDLSVHAATLENYMLDFVEAKTFVDYYWSYIKHRMPGETPQFILAPHTVADKIQAYATLAFASRISGNGTKAAAYINQARKLAGTIFDSPQADSVAALVMMSHYWQLVLDIPLARFYSELALALGRLTPVLTAKLQVFVSVGNILIQDRIPRRAKSELVKKEIARSMHHSPWPGCPFMAAAADVMGILGFNVLFPEEVAVTKFFHVIDDVRINEEDRAQIVASIGDLRLHATLNALTISDILFYDMFCSLYQAITEWKSGHEMEALSCAKACINGIQQLNNFKQIGIASDFPHICMLGALCKFLYAQGEYKCVLQICQFIREVCKVMQPEFNFVATLIDDFLESHNIIDYDFTSSDTTYLSPPSPPSPLSPSSPSSISPSSSPSPSPSPSPDLFIPPSHPASCITPQTFTAHTLHPLHPHHANLSCPPTTNSQTTNSQPMAANSQTTNSRTTNTNNQTANNQTANNQTTNYQTTNYQATNSQTTNYQATNVQTTNYHITNYPLNDPSSFYLPDQLLQVISDPSENPYTQNIPFSLQPTPSQTTTFYTNNTTSAQVTNVQTTNTIENSFLDNLLNCTVDNAFDRPLINL